MARRGQSHGVHAYGEAQPPSGGVASDLGGAAQRHGHRRRHVPTLAGLVGFEAGEVTVSVPWEARLRHVPGVKIHRVCRIDDELVTAGIPRVRSPTATIRAANWASSDRQAALLLALPVQQRLITASHL